MKAYSGLIATVSAIGATVLLVYMGYLILDVLVPDPCAYHNGQAETNWLFDLFFPMTATSGFHPEPGNVFYFLALGGGIATGLLINRRLKRTPTS